MSAAKGLVTVFGYGPTGAATVERLVARGQAVRVVTVDATRLSVQVKTERDWFRLQGRADLDEGRVMELAEHLGV